MSAGGTARWPLELRLKRPEKLLEIVFDDGSRFSLPAEYLRVESPSAEVKGHGPGQKTLVHGRGGAPSAKPVFSPPRGSAHAPADKPMTEEEAAAAEAEAGQPALDEAESEAPADEPSQ